MARLRQLHPRLRNRRGAVIVWFALSLMSLLMFTAIAFDLGFWYVAQAELQTAADAGALRGARALMLSTAVDPSPEVKNAVVAFSASNKAEGRVATIRAEHVCLVRWTPPADGAPLPAPSCNLGGQDPNGVWVGVRQAGSPLFSRIFSNLTPQLQRGAVAWVANVNGARCIKPWSIPITKVWSLAGDTDGQLDPEEVARLQKMTDLERTVMLSPPPKTNPGPKPPPPAPDGQWDPIVYKEPNNGVSGYQANVVGNCQNNAVLVNDVYDHPGANMEDKTTQAVTGDVPGGGKNQTPVCYFNGGANNASCYASAAASSPGVRTLVVYGTTATTNGKTQVTVKMIGEFVVVCYKRANDKFCGSPKYPDLTPYSEGTMVGYIKPNFWNLNDVVYGNTPSIASRLVLVR